MSAFAQKFANAAQKSRHYATVRKQQQEKNLIQAFPPEQQQPVAVRKRPSAHQPAVPRPSAPHIPASKRAKAVANIALYRVNNVSKDVC